jgi:hypothetical protein
MQAKHKNTGRWEGVKPRLSHFQVYPTAKKCGPGGSMPCMQFQIASHSSTAISTFRTTPPPAVLAPGPLQFQGVAGATAPPPNSLFRLRARRENAVFWAGLGAAGTRSTSSTDFSDRRHWQAAPPYLSSPPKKCEPPAVLRSFASGGLAGRVCDPANPWQLYGLACPPTPHPLPFYAHCLPCDFLRPLASARCALTGIGSSPSAPSVAR